MGPIQARTGFEEMGRRPRIVAHRCFHQMEEIERALAPVPDSRHLGDVLRGMGTP